MKKPLTTLLCILISGILLASSVSFAQVVHEDPAKLYPSDSLSVNEQLGNIVQYMLAYLEMNSEDIKANDFVYANESFSYFNETCDDYLAFLKRTNISVSDYQAIAGNLNFTRDDLSSFIANAALYNLSYDQYDAYLNASNNAGASASAGQVRASYGNIAEAYDRFRENATLIEKVLESNDVDTTSFDNAMNNLNDFMGEVSYEYNQPGINNNSTDLRLTVDPATAPIGETTRITVTWITLNGTPVSGTVVKVYSNNYRIGSFTTDASGAGYMNYTVPVNVSSDALHIHAEAVASDANKTHVYSDQSILSVPDKQTTLTLNTDADSSSYGGSVVLSGQLKAADGMAAPGKSIGIFLNDGQVGSTSTDVNGSYAFTYNVTPDTPSGKSMVQAKYDRRPNGVFLSSSSPGLTIGVNPKSTVLTVNDDGRFSIGDMAHVRGALSTDDGSPVKGANIRVYIDDRLYGNNTTVDSGAYDVIIRIPDNATAGPHELFARFQPENGTALRGAASDKLRITINDRTQLVQAEGLPIILFKGEVLNVNGTLVSGSGVPIADKALVVNVTGMGTNSVRTDKNGSYNLSYLITDNMTFGEAQVAIYDEASGGLDSPVLYSGQALIVPYDKIPAAGAPILLIAAILAVAFFFIRSRPDIRPPRQIIVEPKAPEKVLLKPTVSPISGKARIETQKLETPGVPQPFKITAPAMHEPKFEARPKPAPVHPVDFSLDDEINSIKARINESDLAGALTLVYLASRKLASIHGVDVTDSMTHNEFYAIAVAKNASFSKPLSLIVNTYEKVGFARYPVNNADMNAAINSLKELYVALKAQEGKR